MSYLTKEMTLRMPDEIHHILVNLKKKFRVSVNSTIMTYIARGLIKDELYSLKNLMANNNHTMKPSDTNIMPEELKFCDGDKCAVPIHFTELKAK